jgi:DNA polymerase-3 subunit epsilon
MNITEKLNGRPLCVFDIEGTGTNPASDRIVTIAILKILKESLPPYTYHFEVNPGVEMSEEVIAVHGITNEMAAKWEPFSAWAESIFDAIKDCDLAGFNLFNYDIPLLWEELSRCGIEWRLDGIRIIDAGNVFKKKEERTLSAAVQFYLDRNHDGAHEAGADVAATLDVLNAQITRYTDLQQMSLEGLATFSRFDDRIDLAGKIIKGKDGRPTYTIGKVRGVAVEDDPGFAYWMLGKDFSANTKAVLRKILEDAERA